MRIQSGPFLIFSDFDSGNILTAENVQLNHSSESLSTAGRNQPDYEMDVCTKPDCFGTMYQNGNRTWFHFGIQGGKPGGVLKLNILNLNKQVKLFTQGMQPVFRYLPYKPNWERVSDKLVINEKEAHICSISFRQRLPEDVHSTLYVAFTYPFSHSELTEWLNGLDTVYSQTKLEGLPFHVNCKLGPVATRAELLMLKSARSTKNQIYYHRECLCYSVEGRRVDLVTITSCEGMSEDREDRLPDLFPLLAEERPHKFPNKKVIFLSARVHPGETPSSFVLNGLYKFLLEPTDPRALLLRKLFVFKLIPMLNPDGVALGHYRSDSRGVNLNRVYLQPSQTLHPSIFACRKLLLYYHFGTDTHAADDNGTKADCDGPSSPRKVSGGSDEAGCHSQPVSRQSRRSSPRTSRHARRKQRPHSAEGFDKGFTLRSSSGEAVKPSSEGVRRQIRIPHQEFHATRVAGSGGVWSRDDASETTFEACDEDSLVYLSPSRMQTANIDDGPKTPRPRGSFSPSKRKEKTISANQGKRSRSQMSTMSSVSSNASRLFCYIDMHGHATKRGIFMYGNHFEDAAVQAECMLLPKLMSLNCPNFDFSACNFTERLMSMRDRKDGASREGSGRVAIFKLTGLIRSYTLECNYNTGRMVNNVLNRGSLLGLADGPKFSPHPPKFTPEIFEDAGRSLAESLLDLTSRNPWSRIGFTEFKSIDGMRKWLLKRVQASRELDSSDYLIKRSSSGFGGLCKADSHSSVLQAVKQSSSKAMKKQSSLLYDKAASGSKTRKREKVKAQSAPSLPSLQTRSNSSNLLLKSFKATKKPRTKDATKK